MEGTSLEQQKRKLRQQVSQERDSLPPEARREKSRLACQHLLSFAELSQCETVMAFYPFRSELDVRSFLDEAISRGQQVWLPLTLKTERKIVPYLYSGEHMLRRGEYGICEPDPSLATAAELHRLRAVILPGMAFDRQGGRLGYGGGYYDRFLASLPHRPLLIGVGYALQVKERVPVEPHDYLLDYLVTEEGVIGPFDK